MRLNLCSEQSGLPGTCSTLSCCHIIWYQLLHCEASNTRIYTPFRIHRNTDIPRYSDFRATRYWKRGWYQMEARRLEIDSVRHNRSRHQHATILQRYKPHLRNEWFSYNDLDTSFCFCILNSDFKGRNCHP